MREFKADFLRSDGILNGVSFDNRPDSVSPDHLLAFTVGPYNLNDTAQGYLNRAWYVVDRDGDVYYARENNAFDGWGNEVLLFSYSGTPIKELDCCFDQNARLNVIAERASGPSSASEIWLYWFNPTLSAFTFESFGAGRTPRIVLDNPFVIGSSDVLIFYFSGISGGLKYRVQSAQYAVENAAPIASGLNRYLEKVGRTNDRRVKLVYSERNLTTGKYALYKLLSSLYGITTDADSFESLGKVISGELRQLHLTNYFTPEGIDATGKTISGLLELAIYEEEVPGSGTIALVLNSMELQSIVISDTTEIESFEATGKTISGEIKLVVIVDTAEVESFDATGKVISGELIVFP